MLEEALSLFGRSDDSWATAFALLPLGHVALLEGQREQAEVLHTQALEHARRIDDEHLVAQVLVQLAVDAVLTGQFDEALARFAAAAALLRTTHDQEGIAYCLYGLASLALALGAPAAAARLMGSADHVIAVVGLAVWPLLQPLSRELDLTISASLDPAVDQRDRAAGAATPALAALSSGLDHVATLAAHQHTASSS
jgi:tetratricopeptide (TPR) repeat protein